MKVLVTVACKCCGFKEEYVCQDSVCVVPRFWRVSPEGVAFCADSECDEAARDAGAEPLPVYVGQD